MLDSLPSLCDAHPALALKLAAQFTSPEQQARLKLIPPSQLSEGDPLYAQYLTMVQRLNIRRVPNLIIMPHDVAGQIGKNLMGLYDGPSNSVILRDDIFASYADEGTMGKYIVAHELGHKKGYTRRMLLLKGIAGAGAAAAGGVAAKLTHVAGDYFLTDDTQHADGTTNADSKKEVVKNILALSMGMSVFNQQFPALLRALERRDCAREEFRADGHASTVMPADEIIFTLATEAEQSIASSRMRYRQPLIIIKEQIRNAVDQHTQGMDITPHQRRVLYAAALVIYESPLQPLSALHKGTYPTFGDRAANFAGMLDLPPLRSMKLPTR